MASSSSAAKYTIDVQDDDETIVLFTDALDEVGAALPPEWQSCNH